MGVPVHPRFEWSYSRWSMFEFCQRKFWFRYCGHWGGWLDTATDRCKTTYMLSKLTTIPAWAGGIAHSGFARLLMGATVSEIVPDLRSRMEGDFAASRDRRFDDMTAAKRGGLVEHYYRTTLDDHALPEAQDKVEQAVRALSHSEFPEMAREARAAGRFVQIENADRDGRDFHRMKWKDPTIGPFDIYSQPDCIVEHKPNRFLILDWKTGALKAQHDDAVTSLQLSLYVTWARWKHPERFSRTRLDWVEAYEVFLPGIELRGRRLSQDDIDKAYSDVKAKASSMLNKRRPEATGVDFITRESDFAANPTQARCSACEFRAVCAESAA